MPMEVFEPDIRRKSCPMKFLFPIFCNILTKNLHISVESDFEETGIKAMPNSREHSRITANAVALVDSGNIPVAALVKEYCNYPDFYFSDPEKFAPYYFETDGIQFHYPPDTPYNDLYRYWTFRDGSLRRLRKFRNDNYIHMTNGFRHYLTKCIRTEDSEEMLKFAGCLLHVLEDALFSLHAMEGPGGTDLMFLDRLNFFEKPPTEQLVDISALEMEDVTGYTPCRLGGSVEETVMNLYTEYVRKNRDSRRCCFQFLMARHNHSSPEEISAPVRQMYYNTVTLCADVLHTILNLRQGLPAKARDYFLTEIEPFAFPHGGSGSIAFRFRSYGQDVSFDRQGNPVPLTVVVNGENTVFKHGFSFGVHYENALLFQLPEGMFSSFIATVGLAADTVMKNPVTVKIINHDSVISSFMLGLCDAPSREIAIPSPGGVFGIQEFSDRPSGTLIIGQPLLKANRFASEPFHIL